jgi:alpha-1,2-rhamnosyltransferase
MHNKPWINTGIQRVVKGIVDNLDAYQGDKLAVPIIFQKNKVYVLSSNVTFKKIYYFLVFFERLIVKIIDRCWGSYHKNKSKYLTYPINIHRLIWLGYRIFSGFFSVFLRVVQFLRYQVNGTNKPEACCKDDILLLVDASWNSDNRLIIEKLKREGVNVVAVIHDLIPLTHPQFFADNLVSDFSNWFEWVVNTADGLIGVSQHTAAQIVAVSPRLIKKESMPWIDYSYNGAGLSPSVTNNGSLSGRIKNIIENKTSRTLLCVGTLEPRKNHKYILDALESCWSENQDVRLILVGNKGWRCESLVERICNHPMLGNKLFWLKNLSDKDLDILYRYSDALVIASIDEGFGLPIVEALDRNLSVLASDINVFREFETEGVQYFDLSETSALVQLIKNEIPRPCSDWSWYSAEQSAQQLLNKVLARCENQ